MKTVKIVIAVIEVKDKGYLLQLRKGPPEIGGANLIGAIGGKIEEGEGLAEAIAREVAEESTLRPNPEDFEHIGSSVTVSDMKLEPVRVECEEFLLVTDDQEATLVEGETTYLMPGELSGHIDQFTTATRAVYKETLKLI